MEEGNPVPEEIHCTEQIFDISFHPKRNILAAGLIDGAIDIWSYGVEENKNVIKNTSLNSSCRSVLFSNDGEVLYAVSSDQSLQGLNGLGQQVIYYGDAHDASINKIHQLEQNLLATGDDAGEVKLWDIRIGAGSVMSWAVHEDFVSGLTFHEDSHTLLSVSGDATLCTYDIRKKDSFTRSDEQESELHCLSVIKNGKKVLCGTQDGVILVFSWGKWGDCTDRYPGHPQTVDCMAKIDESTILTGSSDGFIRVIAIQPNKILGVIGDHEDFPVEAISTSFDRRVLGSISHDNIIRFWDISLFTEDDGDEFDEEIQSVEGGDVDEEADGDEEGDEQEEEEEEEDNPMEEEDVSSDSDGNDSDDSDDIPKKGPKRLPTKAESFFADL